MNITNETVTKVIELIRIWLTRHPDGTKPLGSDQINALPPQMAREFRAKMQQLCPSAAKPGHGAMRCIREVLSTHELSVYVKGNAWRVQAKYMHKNPPRWEFFFHPLAAPSTELRARGFHLVDLVRQLPPVGARPLAAATTTDAPPGPGFLLTLFAPLTAELEQLRRRLDEQAEQIAQLEKRATPSLEEITRAVLEYATQPSR